MINTKRPPLNYHCTHAHWQVAKVIEWLESLGGGGRTLPDSWNAFSPAPQYVLAAQHSALNLAINRAEAVVLVVTQMTPFETVRRLMLEAAYPQPTYFANGHLLESDFPRFVSLAKRIQDAPFYLWEPMELKAEELYDRLALLCEESGTRTVVVDDPLMISGMSGNQAWVKLANHLHVEILLYGPIEASGSMEI
jgi:replicative DNA helicase